MKRLSLLGCIVFLISCGCSQTINNSVPENTPESNFELLWQEYDRLYAAFELKKLDWNSVYATYRPQVTMQTTDQELFNIFSAMLETFKDGHVGLITPFDTYQYTAWWDQFPRNYDRVVLETNYFGQLRPGTRFIRYRLLDAGIGYVYIRSFTGSGWGGDIETALNDMGDIQGLIVDVRNNGGGNGQNALDIAGRFTHEAHLFRYIQLRDGPNHGDFTPMRANRLEPKGSVKFTKPTVILTNRRTYSAAESFVLMMRVLPHVTVVGDTTGGGSASPVSRELPNGWTYHVPRWLAFTAEQRAFEGVGLAPDIWVSTPDVVLSGGRDLIFEKGVEILKSE